MKFDELWDFIDRNDFECDIIIRSVNGTDAFLPLSDIKQLPNDDYEFNIHSIYHYCQAFLPFKKFCNVWITRDTLHRNSKLNDFDNLEKAIRKLPY